MHDMLKILSDDRVVSLREICVQNCHTGYNVQLYNLQACIN